MEISRVLKATELVAIAMALPTADPKDLVVRLPHGGVPSKLLKVVADPSLRQRLIASRIAEPLQTPRGRQRIAAVVRIYPDRDAPHKSSEAEPSLSATPITPMAKLPTGSSLPTLEAMSNLVGRLKAEELRIGDRLTRDAEARISELKLRLAGCDDRDLETVHAELGTALDERRALESHARAEAWRLVESDQSFPDRVHLRVLARP